MDNLATLLNILPVPEVLNPRKCAALKQMLRAGVVRCAIDLASVYVLLTSKSILSLSLLVEINLKLQILGGFSFFWIQTGRRRY